MRYFQASIEIPSNTIARIEAISKEYDIFLVVGVVERDGGTLYCTAVFIDPLRGFIAKHRKLVPAAMERIIWGQGGRDTLPVIEKEFSGTTSTKTKISATICWYGSLAVAPHMTGVF